MEANDFKYLVNKAAKQVNVTIKEIHIRKMKRKWASCSTKGRLTFDPEILKEPYEKGIEYILHELLHLRYTNHGVMFKQMLKKYKDDLLKKETVIY